MTNKPSKHKPTINEMIAQAGKALFEAEFKRRNHMTNKPSEWEKVTVSKEHLARYMHDLYERLAVEEGWSTQKKTRVDFEHLPESNKRLMIRVAGNVSILYWEWFEDLLTKQKAELLKPLVEAWLNEGPMPSYHRQWQERLKEGWPTLYNAILDVLKESND